MRRVALVLLAFALLTAGGEVADAARRMKFTAAMDADANSERVVKVMELPRKSELRSQGENFDLGYLMRGDGSGEWVGYIGSSTRYVPFGPQSIAYVMQHAGITELPPAPVVQVQTVGGEDVDPRLFLWLLPLAGIVVAVILVSNRPPRVKLDLPKPKPEGGEWVKKAQASVNAAAPPIESPIIKAARERAERLRQQTPAVRGQIAKSPEMLNRPDFGRLGGRRSAG